MPLSHCGNFYMPTNLKATVYSDAVLGSGCACLNFTTQLPYNPKIGRWETTVDTCGGVTVRVAWNDELGGYFLTYSCDGFQQAVAQQTCNPFFAAALFSAGTCCPKPGKAADVYVSGPEMPLEVARICACPCDCASGGNPPPSFPPGFGVAPPYHKPGHPRELSVAPVRYSTGELVLAAGDLAGGGFGMPWGHTRSFANRQADNFDAGQGYNWRVAQWPFLTVLGDGPLVATFDANNSIWFDAVGDGYAARHGETALLVYDAVADVFRLTDERGNATEYNGSTLAFSAHIDAAGNRTEVVSYLNDAALNPTEVQRSYTDSSGATTIESFVYGYQSNIDGIWRLASVLLRRSTDGGVTWINIRQAVYTYWTDDDAYGALGDLKTAAVQTWQDGAWADLTTTLYRYYKAPPFTPDCDCGSSSSSSSPVDPGYLAHLLKYVIEPDSYARLAADPNTGGDPANAPDWLAALYADNYFEYDEQRRVTLESVEGASRTYTYAYSASTFTPNGDYNTWVTKTVETLPGGTQNVTYANDIGQVMLSVKIPGAGQPGNGPWYEYFRYDASANRILRAESSAVTGYDESYADLLNCQSSSSSSSVGNALCGVPICSGNLQYLADHSGLIHLYDYDPASGQVIRERIRNGEFGCDNKLWERVYTAFSLSGSSSSSSSSGSGGTFGGPVYLLTESIDYPDDITVDPNQSRQIITGYAYTFFLGTLQVRTRTTTWPVVSTEQNGSGVADSRVEVFDSYGNLNWTLDERGFIHYQGHDVATGAVIQTVTDFDTSLTGQPTPPAGWTTPTGGGLNLITDITVDSLGRTTQVLGPWHEIDISGVATSIRRATWTIYQDAAFQIWSGQGYITSNGGDYTYMLMNPVSITMMDASGRVTDQISATRGDAVESAGALSATDSFPQSSYCRWTTNQWTDCCKQASTRKYFLIPASGIGTPGVNYWQTNFGYDFLNRRNRVVGPEGTITRIVFDARDMQVSTWIGTNDTGATWLDPTGGGAPGNNMVMVASNEYDNNQASGDSNQTAVSQYVDASTVRTTLTAFDWRDRAVQTTAAQDYYFVTTFDNISRAIQNAQYSLATGKLIRLSQSLYDDRSRVYQNLRYGVDPDTGAIGNYLVGNTWYDGSNNIVMSLPAGSAAFTQSLIDGAGRGTVQYVGYYASSSSSSSAGGGSALPLPTGEGRGEGASPSYYHPTYAQALDISGAIIVEQTETAFDDAGNTIQTTFRQRFHNATGAGPLTYPGGAQPQARVSYVAMYPDGVGRAQATANYGTNGDVTLVRPDTIPARADTVLVDSTYFNDRGEAYQAQDPAGTYTFLVDDDAGRRIEQILNYTSAGSSSSSSSSSSSGGLPASDDTNVTTFWTYTADDQILATTAVNAETGNQTTTNLFGTALPSSGVARNDVQSGVLYADGRRVSFLVNRQSEVKQFTDQRGVVHQYTLDLLGRKLFDSVISFISSSSSSSSSLSSSGSGVDSTVQRIGWTYEVRGLVRNITSFSSAIIGEGVVVNDVQRVYNSFEQPITEYQEHNGAVNPATSVNVQYQYADGSANIIRPTELNYPNGRVLYYDYGSSGGMDDALGRIASLIDSDVVTHLVDYTRIGMDTFVQQSSPQPQIAWSLINGTGLDPYTGLDQFDRVVDNRWYSIATSTDLDRVQRGYDRASNPLWRRNTVADAAGVYLDELYSHDGLYRLSEMQRGQLNATNTDIVAGTLSFAQAWRLDATGNWQQFRQSATGASWDLQQSRTANKLNEITGIIGGGWAQTGYDAAGNTIQMPQVASPATANAATFDAWNRMTKVFSGGSLIEQNAYDGEDGRVTMFASGALRHFYYSVGCGSLEERLGSSFAADRQFLFGLRYGGDVVLRDRGAERFYALQDANGATAAICSVAGAIGERYLYAQYGVPTFLMPSFSTETGSAYNWETLFEGFRRDAETGLYVVCERHLNPMLGFWLTQASNALGRFAISTYEFRDERPSKSLFDGNLNWHVRNRQVFAVDPFRMFGRLNCDSINALQKRHCSTGLWQRYKFCLKTGPLFPTCISLYNRACCILNVTTAGVCGNPLAVYPFCTGLTDPDSCYHCMATCEVSLSCGGPLVAIELGGLLEFLTFLDSGFLWDSLTDLIADYGGLACYAASPPFFPQWARMKICECCCQKIGNLIPSV